MRQRSGLVLALGAGLLWVASAGTSGQVAKPKIPIFDEPVEAPIPPPPKVLTPVAQVETLGWGPVHVVLIPTLACDASVWSGFMARNAAKYTMHAVTLPGFGGSAPPPVEDGTLYYSAPWMNNAEHAIAKVIDDLKLDRPVLIGHGMGGHLALRVAVRQQSKVGCVISLDGFPAMPLGGLLAPQTGWRVRREMIDGVIQRDFHGDSEAEARKDVIDQIAGGTSNAARQSRLAAMVSSVPIETIRRYKLEWLAGDVILELPRLKIPCLVVAAIPPADFPMLKEERELLPRAWGNQVSGGVLNAVGFVENSLTFVMDDQPDQVDQMIEQFLKQAEEKGLGTWGGAGKSNVPAGGDPPKP